MKTAKPFDSKAYRLSMYGHLEMWVPGSNGIMWSGVGMTPERREEVKANRDKRIMDAAHLLMDHVLTKEHLRIKLNTPMRRAVMRHIRTWSVLDGQGKYNVLHQGQTVTVWMMTDTIVEFHCHSESQTA
jgi:hypothetical protein